ncbi:MAG: glutaredoxin family protein [Nitrospirota bacterium]|nr:MAG: glutaredoxin family protein [Nitrospirota bacterium]
MKRVFIFTILCLTIVLGSIANAEMYKWTDKKGNVHYSNVPPQDSAAEEVNPQGGVNIMGTHEVEPEPEDTAPKSEKAKNFISNLINSIKGSVQTGPKIDRIESGSSDQEVDLYVTSWCGYCKKARNFLLANGVSFNEYDIERDSDAAQRKMQLDGRRGVPFAVINGKKIHGWSEPAYRAALGL